VFPILKVKLKLCQIYYHTGLLLLLFPYKHLYTVLNYFPDCVHSVPPI
jgi:hypothetical protein